MNAQDTGNADFSYWSKVRMWSPYEAAALLLGYDPECKNHPKDSDLYDLDAGIDAIRVEIEKIEKILISAQVAGELGDVQTSQMAEPWKNTVSASQWLSWARQNGFEVDSQLMALTENVAVSKSSSDLSERKERTYLNIIGGLLGIMFDKNTSGKSNSVFRNDSDVINALTDKYNDKQGISERNLQKYFPRAKDSIAR